MWMCIPMSTSPHNPYTSANIIYVEWNTIYECSSSQVDSWDECYTFITGYNHWKEWRKESRHRYSVLHEQFEDIRYWACKYDSVWVALCVETYVEHCNHLHPAVIAADECMKYELSRKTTLEHYN